MHRKDLKKHSVNAVKWSVIGTVAKFGLQLLAQIVLARLLGPENYGLFAVGLIVLTFSNFVADFGFAWGLVQSQNISDDDIRFVFTWQMLSGAAVAAILFTSAPLIASFFHEIRVVPIIRWLSLACIFNAMAAPATNLLRRKLDFKTLNIIQVTSYSLGYLAVGIPLAIYGFGVWALVAAWLVQSFSSLIQSYIRSPHSIKPLFWFPGASSLSQTGMVVFVTNISNWFLNNLDRILLGRLMNAHAVGLYVVGYNLANTPNSLLLGALQPAFLTAGARIQSDLQLLRRSYLSVLATVWILITPLFVLLAVLAQDLISLIYGKAWGESGIVLTILALAMPAYVTWGMSTPILWNTGKKQLESLLQLPILLLAALAYYRFAGEGVQAAALVASGVLVTRAFVIASAACRQLGIRISDLGGFAIRGVTMATIVGLSGVGGSMVGREIHTSTLAALLGGGCFGVLALAAAPMLFPQLLGTSVIQMLERFTPALAKLLTRNRNHCIGEAS